MALSTIGVGSTANDGTGDPLRTAFQTVNTAITAVNNAVVVGTGTTTFKDDSGTYGVAVASNGDVTFTNGGTNVGMTWDASANSNAGGLGIGTATPSYALHVVGTAYATQVSAYAALGTAPASGSGNTGDYQILVRGDGGVGDAAGIGFTMGTVPSSTGVVGAAVVGVDEGAGNLGGLRFLTGAGSTGISTAMSIGGTGIITSLLNDFIWQNAGVTVGMTWDASALSNAGALGIGTPAPTEQLDLSGDAIRIRTAQTPASAAATGDAGMICWDANYIYVCTATNTWKRVAIATW